MTSKKVYLLSCVAIILASVYPVYMGGLMVSAYIKDGGIEAANYPSYVIPYTPICAALIICTALLPLAYRLCRRFALPILTALGAVLFLAVEVGFEKIAVFADLSGKINVETWQLFSCVATPQVRSGVWDSLNIRYNPAFKIHFYAIALLIVFVVIGVMYLSYKMAKTQNFSRTKPLVAQLVSVIVFIGLCILACFTAFFRTGDINIPPVSTVLMTIFFVVFGITAGVYTGTWLYGKKALVSMVLPSVTSMLVTVMMYIGEMVMMNQNLFRRGSGFMFSPLGAFPLSIFDIVTIFISGIVTYFILNAIKQKKV